jgi:hydrogenase maturation protease
VSATQVRRVLIAGIGNVFLGDDGFGVEVVGSLDASTLPPSADVRDYGVAGVHLAYDVLDHCYETLILVDAAPVDGPPGTLAVLRCVLAEQPAEPSERAAVDAHAMTPQSVLDVLSTLGCSSLDVLVIGCQPAVLDERMGLSEPVRRMVPQAAALARSLAWEAIECSAPGRAGAPDAAAGMERARA